MKSIVARRVIALVCLIASAVVGGVGLCAVAPEYFCAVQPGESGVFASGVLSLESLASGFSDLLSPNSWSNFVSVGVIGGLTTALVEELVFRGIGIPVAQRLAPQRAIWGTALVFALCHVVVWGPNQIAAALDGQISAALGGSSVAIVLLCIAVRLVQAFLFGMIVGTLFAALWEKPREGETREEESRPKVSQPVVAWVAAYLACVAVHFVYDLLYFGPASLLNLPLEPTASLGYAAVLAASAALLLVAYLLVIPADSHGIILRWLKINRKCKH